MEIYCCGCQSEVDARLTNGKEIYPHRHDLCWLPFWKCDTCGNFVGCHYKTKNRTAPLGCIPTPEIKNIRMKIHIVIDPIWQSGKLGRKEIYRQISEAVGFRYHTAKLRSVEDATRALVVAKGIFESVNGVGV